MKFWRKLSQEQIKDKVFRALELNINYEHQFALGVPASYLDSKVFNQDADFVQDAPFISTLVQNPNHIGCHTLGQSESYFSGTQAIERELIEICAVDILHSEPNTCDGYIASGGTEANIQAAWIYRNFFMREHHASSDQIAIICSSDAHYSVSKASNILQIDIFKVPVDFNSRLASAEDIAQTLSQAKANGKTCFIVICNMMTTMFGSVDEVNTFADIFDKEGCPYKIHIDGAYGGFYYPFLDKTGHMSFSNPRINSFTMDAHKMAQAPYGTGIFLIRKGYMHYVNNKDAKYVQGEDFTLIGSRSGANAVAVWMILSKNGPYEWEEKIFILQKRASWFCDQLHNLGIEHYRHPWSNIITIKAKFVKAEIAKEFSLVPDNHAHPTWYKIVVMEHVTVEKLLPLKRALLDSY